ncbi:MAG: hypothetical protein GXO21_01600 [Aquificae bacterium]|nr:hypothetical protein [Aquificota bacterium]
MTAVLSIFITNDVALMVVVPITLATKVADLEKVIVLEAMAANGGSSISPFGNPQNIFIYFHFNIHFLDFIKEIFPLFLVSTALIILLTPKKSVFSSMGKYIIFDKKTFLYLVFFAVFIAAVLGFLPLWVGFFIILPLIFIDRQLFKVDYFLLGTFFFFFGFTDNIHHVFNIHFHKPSQVFLYSAFLSQVISNVPATLFLADFVHHWQALLWGVSVGGFGNLIGSLANLIAYKLYVKEKGNSLKFFLTFHIIGYIFFIAGIVLFFLIYIC